LPKAKGLAERALELNGTLSSAHCSLGIYATFEEWDWPKAESRFQRAIELEPKNLEAHAFRGLLLRLLGRTDEALGEFETAVSLNPRSQVATRFLGFGFMSARRYPEAVARFRKAAELADCPLDFWLLADALSWDGKLDEAIRWLEHASVAYGASPVKARTEAQTLGLAVGRSGVAGFRRKRLEIRREDRIDPIDLAGDCAAAGRVEEALDLLDRAWQVHHAFLVFDLTTHPTWDSLRSTPRFQALLTRLHLSSIPPK
jgi:tetratricopeptide (TPR) repeat protein